MGEISQADLRRYRALVSDEEFYRRQYDASPHYETGGGGYYAEKSREARETLHRAAVKAFPDLVSEAGHAAALRADLARVTAERDAYVHAIDEAMVTRELGVFEHGQDIKAALNSISAWDQGVGAYFAKEENADLSRRLGEAVEALRLVREHGNVLARLDVDAHDAVVAIVSKADVGDEADG